MPQLYEAARRHFARSPPSHTFTHKRDFVEVWDGDDFRPWESLRWQSVRVMRYHQHKPDGTVVEAYWLTNFPRSGCGGRALFAIAKSRWEIENQGFNDAKTRHGMEHIRHHHANSLLIDWLLVVLALTVERLYRLRYLHRGNNAPMSSHMFVTYLLLSIGPSPPPDSS